MHFQILGSYLSISWFLASSANAAVDGPCRNAVSPPMLSLETGKQLLHTNWN
jgi:hypothetical protein